MSLSGCARDADEFSSFHQKFQKFSFFGQVMIYFSISNPTLASLCVCVSRSRPGLCCLPTSLCQHASGSALGCDVLLHAALPRTGQWGSKWGRRYNLSTSPTELRCDSFVSFVLFWQFAMVEVMVTSFMDEFYQHLMKFFKRKELFVLLICGAAFLIGIPCVLQVRTVIYWMN